MNIIELTCTIGFCLFLALAAISMFVSIFTTQRAYGPFLLSLITALILWSLSHLA